MNPTRIWLLGSLLALAPLAAAAPNSPVAGQSSSIPQVSTPIWAKPDHFWFRRTLQGGSHVWLTVDALHGVKEPLFDHQRLAIEMTIRTGYEYTPVTLPFAEPAMQFVVKYDGANAYIQQGALAIEFILASNLWRCDLQIKWDWNRVPPTDYECLSRRPAPPGQAVVNAAPVKRSPDGKWEAFVQNHNLAIRPAGASETTATVLTSDGTASDAYQAGSILWSPDSQSLSAYRVNSQVWESESVSGNVKKHILKREIKLPQ